MIFYYELLHCFVKGRILNRFTKDMVIIDDNLPWTLIVFLEVHLKFYTYIYVFVYLHSICLKYSVWLLLSVGSIHGHSYPQQ